MELQTEITRKEINFINDIDLRTILRDRLKELDKIFLVNAHYSTIFLAISTIEGILKHIAFIYKKDLKNSPNYPQNEQGKPKEFNELTINEFYILLKEKDILPNIKNFEYVYDLFRNYRNFIHPQAQAEKEWPTDLGHAQMAIGLLNATISDLSRYIFIDKEIFEIIAGNPEYDSSKVLYLKYCNTPLHSLLIWKKPVSNALSLSFDLELHKGSVFNFVFNFANDGNFKMLRLDNRQGDKNCVLHCTQKYYWKERLFSDPEIPPEGKPILPVKINIDFEKKEAAFSVDEILYKFKDKDSGRDKNLFEEFRPNLRIGFFNEVGPVSLSNIRIE